MPSEVILAFIFYMKK